ncbi:MAG: globin [Burkholderiales bacterium]|nr:globin [Anaerolineae bacterium]
MPGEEHSIYELAGGEATFARLVDAFYTRVEADPMLRSMFPDDLEAGKHWQFLFLMQYFGGPTRYAEERGHPRLRMRHQPFPIGLAARDAWLGHMLAAIDAVGIAEPARSAMRQYFVSASAFMVNTVEPQQNASEGTKA